MWFPTQNDAVEMFARFLKARHGTAASKLARKTAASLQNEGDVNGCKIWTQVADSMDQKTPSTTKILEPS